MAPGEPGGAPLGTKVPRGKYLSAPRGWPRGPGRGRGWGRGGEPSYGVIHSIHTPCSRSITGMHKQRPDHIQACICICDLDRVPGTGS